MALNLKCFRKGAGWKLITRLGLTRLDSVLLGLVRLDTTRLVLVLDVFRFGRKNLIFKDSSAQSEVDRSFSLA